MASGDTRTQQYLDVAANGTRADLPSDTCCETRTQTLIRGVAERIMDVEDEVERLENNPDVADIVATYADLQAYPTSQLTDKDVIRVLQDETHDGDSTYYRWSTATQTWTYIGESKQYSDFVGTDGTAGGQNGLVPAPVATDAGKFLNANGSWEEVQAGPTVVQTTGTSATDVMSQNAVTSMVFADPSTRAQIRLGYNAGANGTSAVAIGYDARALGAKSITLGETASTAIIAEGSVALGAYSRATVQGSVALGAYSRTQYKGEVNIGPSNVSYGYNNSSYRLLTGVYDPQNAHDAATKGYVDTAVSTAGGASISNAEFNTIFGTSLTEGA